MARLRQITPMQVKWTRAAVVAAVALFCGQNCARAQETSTNKARSHWAFQAPVRPAIPKIKSSSKNPVHPIDAFVAAKLEEEGLDFSPPADAVTLLRRLHLDLMGLPPSIAEVEAFEKDSSPAALSRVIERGLASPHYGERWGRHWLDAARYADTDGFEKDKTRFMWVYRDWVIGAFNRDMPYDRFILEQVAGDQLPGAGQDQVVATGFLRNAMLNEEGGVDPEQFRMDGLFDRMDCIGKSVLGLTIQCAQCHNHKFDPISQQDYYRMFSFLNNDHEGFSIAYSPDEQMLRSNLLRQVRDLEEGLRHSTSDWEQRMAAWEDSVRNDQPEWQVVRCINAGDNGERFYYYDDGSIRAASYAPTKWTATFRGTNSSGRIGAFRIEYLNDPNLPCNGPGRSLKGMCALTEFNVDVEDIHNPTNKVKVKFVKASADFSHAERDLEAEFDDKSGKPRPYGPVAFAIDGKDNTAWGIDAGPGRRNVPRKAVFVPEKPLEFTNAVVLTFRLMQNHGGWNSDDNMTHNLGRYRLSVTGATNAVADPVPAAVREIFRIPRDRRSPAQVATVFSYWRTTVPEFHGVSDRIETLWKQWPEGASQLTLAKRSEPRMTSILRRGDWLKPEVPVTAGVPAFLHPLPEGADDSRLTFAQWLVDKRSPTTARVFVNRIWQSYFGDGIVPTPEEFGTQGTRPGNQELLDWLACEFMEPTYRIPGFESSDPLTPWGIKHLHRLITTSRTYQQVSRVTPDLLKKDPYNRLLARGPRFRVEGEIVRDIALSASGLLNVKMGGPGVFSPAPPSLFLPPNSYGPFTWTEAAGLERYRRAVYTFRRRSTPYPVLAVFDAPNGDFSCVRRTRSNTPLQALTALNEPVFMECAQALASRAFIEGGSTDSQRIKLAFRRVLSRNPAPEEMEQLLQLLERSRKRIAEGWVSATELAVGKADAPKDLPPGATPTQLAALTVVARALLNLDETITKE